MAFSMGLSWSNSRAVLLGWLGRSSVPFLRTPKQGLAQRRRYSSPRVLKECIVEAIFCVYFVAALGYGLYLGDYGAIFFHLWLALGFGGVFLYQLSPR